MKGLTVVIEERPLVLLGLPLLARFVFTSELVCLFEFRVLCLKVFLPDFLPVGAVLPWTNRKLPRQEFSEWDFTELWVVTINVTPWALPDGYGTQFTAIELLPLLFFTLHW